MNKFNSPDYKRSRKAYTIECAIEYFISLLVADAFFAKLLTSIGISDAMTGIISSFITLAFVIQLFSILLVRTKVSTKKLVTVIDTTSIIFFMLIYLVPFLSKDPNVRTILIVLCVLIAYTFKYLVVSMLYTWANSFVEPTKRASFSATKEIISLISGMIFTVIIGLVLDRYEALGNLEGGFLFIAIGVLVLNICNLSCLLSIKKEEPTEETVQTEKLSVVAKNILGNKNFRSIVILSIIWDIARYFTIGFLGVYKTKDLAMSLTLVQAVNIIGNVGRIFISKPFGRYSDKHSYAKGLCLGLYIAAAAFFVNMFTTQTTWWLIIVYTLLYSCSMAGTNQNSYNISYSYVETKYISQAMAIKNSIAGVCGFLASLAGGKLLSVIQASGNTFLGLSVKGQQVLSAISFLLVVICIIFTKTVVEKQKVTVR